MKRNKRYSGLIYKCLTLLVIKRKKSDQRLFLLQDIYCTPLWIKPFPFLSTRQCPPPSHTHSWTVCATQPWSVRHRQPAWSTLLPCSTCLPSNAAVLSAAASVKSFNLLHVFPCTEPSHWQQSNTCKTSKLSSYSQLHEENSIKKSLCSSHLPLWVTGPCRAEAGEGRAARPTVESELSAPRRAALVCQGSFSTDSWTDPPTGCLGWKRRVSFILAHGAPGWRRRVSNQEKGSETKTGKEEVLKISLWRHSMLWRWFLLCCICSTSRALKPTASTTVLI